MTMHSCSARLTLRQPIKRRTMRPDGMPSGVYPMGTDMAGVPLAGAGSVLMTAAASHWLAMHSKQQ